MKAIIMAGGEGTRLRPLTCSIPKPMVPIMNKPVMEHIINLLKNYDINDIAVTLFYLPSVITEYFGNGDSLGVKIIYSIEDKPLGTGGSVLNTGDFIDNTCIVISGDALTDINLKKALEYHKLKKSMVTLIIRKEPIPLEYGVVITDDNGRIIRFLEKPSWGEVFSDTINTGIYILEPSVFNYYSPGDNFDFSRDLFPRLLKDDVPMYGYVADEYWSDIGDLESYKRTHFDIQSGKVKLYNSTCINYNEVNIGFGCTISEKATIIPPALIGSNCTIKDNVFIDLNTVIGDNCIIDENSTLKKSILWNKVTLGKSNQCRSTLIGSKVLTKSGVNLFENSVIGESNTLMDNVTVKPNVKIWPGKKISEGVYVNSSLVWGTKSLRNIFGNRGVCGEINLEITPEFASLLGGAFASSLKKGACITVSCDDSSAGFLIKQSLISGILSSGNKAIDIGNVILPMSRFAVRFYSASGGMHIYQDNNKSSFVNIEFLNQTGGTIDRKAERKIENIFFREDFERGSVDTLSIPMHIDNFHIQYMQNFINQISNIQIIKSKSYKILLSSTSNLTFKLTSLFLESIGCIVMAAKNQNDFDSFKEYIEYFSTCVTSENMSLGVIISGSGENIVLVDNEGNVISSNKYIILSSLLSIKYGNEKKVIVPSTASMIVESIANKYGAEVIRSKSSVSEIINSLLSLYEKNDSLMLQYILNFDGIAAIVKIIDILTGNCVSLNSLCAEIPEFHIRKSEIKCDFKDMGRILRQLSESYKNNSDLFDGIKIKTDNGWSLILPDNEKPIFNIYTEGFSVEYADELSSKVFEKLQTLIIN